MPYRVTITPDPFRAGSSRSPSVRFTNRLKEGVVRINKNISREALRFLVGITPVKTGRARGNWVVSINYRNRNYVENRFDKQGGRTVSAGLAKISRSRSGDAIFITNNVPYIGLLDRGTSRQAPSGMSGPLIRHLELLHG